MKKEKEIAQWLNTRILVKQTFYQEDAVREISKLFGKDFIYIDSESGNTRISRKVLSSFKTLNDKKIEWDTSEKYWYVKFELGDDIVMPKGELPNFDLIDISFEPPELDFQWPSKKRP